MTRDEIIAADFGAAAPAVAALVRNFRPHIGQPNDVLAHFFSNTETPRQACIDWLIKRQGVPVLALAHDGDGGGLALGEAFVEIEGGRFEFLDPPIPEDAARSLVIVARDESGVPHDLVVWAPKTNSVATYRGRCSVLGAHVLEYADIDEVVPVHRGVIEWLKAARNGIVILGPGARRLVEGGLLGAADIEHGLELRRLLQPEPQRIVIPNGREAA